MNIKKILMPTDFSECSQAAFDYALFLAKKYDAQLHLFHAIELNSAGPGEAGKTYPSFEEIASHLDAIARSEMGRMLANRANGIVHIREVERRTVAAAPSIVHYADEENIDVIVIGTHGHRGFRRWLLGSVTEEVLRTADCPVLTIRDDDAARGLEALDRIVVPFDFSVDSDRSLDVAKELAKAYGSCIDVLHVTAPMITTGGLIGAPIIGTSYPDVSQEIELQLSQIVSDDECDIVIEPHVLMGPVAWRIVEFAESEDAELIVIATHGLSGIRRMLIGSVTERVVRSATCPVLVLRHLDVSAEASDSELEPAG